ncbi:MAG: hypothetical protein AAB401_10630 [Acidobacteriota bacterium]
MAVSKLALLESRVTTLEAEVAQLKQQISATQNDDMPWWEQHWGIFNDYPDYEKVVALGRKYRESLRPKQAKAKTSKKVAKKSSKD